jgi:hypothetical protein
MPNSKPFLAESSIGKRGRLSPRFLRWVAQAFDLAGITERK